MTTTALATQTAEKIPAPTGVRLTENQAERIEQMVQGEQPGTFWYPTTHFHGCAEIRQTLNALKAKGIAEEVAGSDDWSGHAVRLTPFGWQVHRQHRLIIRRLDEAEVHRLEAEASR